MASSIAVFDAVYDEQPWTYYPVLIIGAGPSGIAAGCRLKSKLKFDQFKIIERQSGPGGVWWRNRYPGIACDVPSIFYSLSFMPQIEATKLFSTGAEIVRYFWKVCNTYQISDKMQFDTDVTELRWLEDEQVWEVSIAYLLPGKGDMTQKEREELIALHGESAVIFKRDRAKAKVVISCVGGVVEPRDVKGKIPGLETFEGPVMHSARWDASVNLRGKDVVVLGAGSSASQIVPEIIKEPYGAQSVTQIMRSPPWVCPKEMEPGGPEAFAKWSPVILGWAPWIGNLLRVMIFCIMELEYSQLFRTDDPEKVAANRAKVSEGYLKHMRETVPATYHEILTPRYTVGCKRRIFDKTWFPSLNDSRVDLRLGEIASVQPKTITIGHYDPARATDNTSHHHNQTRTKSGANGSLMTNGSSPAATPSYISTETVPCDVLVLANGFDIGAWIHPLNVVGRHGVTIHEAWESRGGAQAYMGTAIDGFPNFFMIFGPNTASGHSSVILACENMVEHALKFVRRIVVTREVDVYEVKEKDCRDYVNEIQRLLKQSVWSQQGVSGCGSWYVKDGWNSTAYPRSQIDFGLRCMFPNMKHWNAQYTYKGRVWRTLRNIMWYGGTSLCLGLYLSTLRASNLRSSLNDALQVVKHYLSNIV